MSDFKLSYLDVNQKGQELMEYIEKLMEFSGDFVVQKAIMNAIVSYRDPELVEMIEEGATETELQSYLYGNQKYKPTTKDYFQQAEKYAKAYFTGCSGISFHHVKKEVLGISISRTITVEQIAEFFQCRPQEITKVQNSNSFASIFVSMHLKNHTMDYIDQYMSDYEDLFDGKTIKAKISVNMESKGYVYEGSTVKVTFQVPYDCLTEERMKVYNECMKAVNLYWDGLI